MSRNKLPAYFFFSLFSSFLLSAMLVLQRFKNSCFSVRVKNLYSFIAFFPDLAVSSFVNETRSAVITIKAKKCIELFKNLSYFYCRKKKSFLYFVNSESFNVGRIYSLYLLFFFISPDHCSILIL